MYSQFYFDKRIQHTEKEHNFQKCILLGNWLMVLCFIITTTCLLVNFGFDELFPLTVQIAGHILTIIFAALFKIGYVVRCVGVHGLGCREF